MSITVKKYISMASTLMVGAMLLTSCEKEDEAPKPSSNPVAQSIDPGEASGGEVLILKGNGLGDIRSIRFANGNVPAPFNPVFNTESAVVFRVPDTAYGGTQDLVFTNSLGKEAKIAFKVIALPAVATASAIEFAEGSEITLTGNNLETVSKVTLEGTTDEAAIVSKSRKQLVIKMPATTAGRAKLKIVNDSGERTTDLELVSMANAFKLFEDSWDPGFENWSWGTSIGTAADNKLAGAAGLKAEYTGAWGGLQMHRPAPISLAPYKFVTFWVKGADVERKINFSFSGGSTQTLVVPAGKWTYFKFGTADLGVSQLEKFVMQINGDPATFYLDNILLVK